MGLENNSLAPTFNVCDCPDGDCRHSDQVDAVGSIGNNTRCLATLQVPALLPESASPITPSELLAGDPHEMATFGPIEQDGIIVGWGQEAPPASAKLYQLPVREMSGNVGDINSPDKGSGARFNGGKTPVDLVPLRQIGTMYIMNGGLNRVQMNAARALQYIGDYQARTRGVEALYDAMLALAGDDIEQAWKECCEVFDYGRKKYAAWNWSKGMKWSVPIGCAGRHIVWGILADEYTDPESGKAHRGHVFCNLVMLIAYATCYVEGDDRPEADHIGAAPVVEEAA